MTPSHSDILPAALRDVRELADPRRLRREHARWEGLNQATRLARIIVLDHGGRSRPVIHRGSRHLRSKVVSRKTRQLQVSEGKGLRFLIQRCEIDGHVVDFQAHPFRIDIVVDGMIMTWYPDLVWVRRGERPRLIEVKADLSALKDPEYRAKLENMMELAQRIGWSMQILYDEDIFGPRLVRADRWTNVNAIHSRRFMTVTPFEQRAVSRAVAAARPTTWELLRNAAAPADATRGDAVVERAIAQGQFSVDLDHAITPRTVLTPLAAAPPTATIRI